MGKGTIRDYMDSHVVELQHVLFVPDLEDTLLLAIEYIKSPNFSLKNEKNSYTLQYPTFSIKARLDNELHVNITAYSDLNVQPDFKTEQKTVINQHHKILRTINKKVSTVQKSMIITLIIMHLLSIIHKYSSREIIIRSNRVYLPLKHIITERKPDNSTIETVQYTQQIVTKLSTKFIIPHPHPKLYGSSTTQRPKNITILCIYKPKSTKTVQTDEKYNLDNYLKQYIAQYPSFTTYIKRKTIPKLPPPRTPLINVPTPKVSDTVNAETYNFPQYFSR